jgi:hypothetical protein
MATLASIGINITGDSKELSTALETASSKMQAFGERASQLGKTLSTRLTLPIIGAAALAIREFGKEEDAIARLNGALRANAGQANITANEVKALAESLETTTNVTADATMNAAALLSTFHQVSNQAGENNDVFTRTIKVSADLAALMGTDMTSATMQLAKALENPTIGLGALSRSGTTFTEQQKEMIQTLVESGRQLEAQTMILDVVESQYKGIAEELARTTSGRIKNALNELGKTVDSFGQIMSEALLPMLEVITGLAKRLETMDESTKRFAITIAGLTAAFGPALFVIGQLTIAVRVLTATMLANPYLAVGAAIAGIGVAAHNAIKPVDDLNKAIRQRLGMERGLTGSPEEQNRLLAEQERLNARLLRAEADVQAARDTYEPAFISATVRFEEAIRNQMKAVRELYRESVALGNASGPQLATKVKVATEAVQELGTTMQSVDLNFDEVLSPNVDLNRLPMSLNEVNEQLGEYNRLLGMATTQAERDRITALAEGLVQLRNGYMGIVSTAGVVPTVVRSISAEMVIAQQLAESFTNSFGVGLANVIVQGNKLGDVLKNIGKLLLSSAIQTGIKLLLLGTAGFGVNGGTTGIIGGLFGAGAGVPAVAGSALSLDGAFTLQGTDLVLAINRSERSFR